jgi:tetratricopeptide (TPR) repeat protein
MSPARDMPGRVLYEGFDIRRSDRTVASYEGTGARAADAGGGDAAVDPAILERLRALGYLDTESPTGDRNLAALLFQDGRYAEAAEAYRELVAARPEDGAVRASLAGVLGAMGRYDEALDQADAATRLAPLNPEGYHNRAVILEKMEQRDRAVEQYREAVRYSPGYEPSLRALERRGVAAAPAGYESGEEKEALQLAERASQAARRGDYAGAMELLDEAEGLAPDVALVHQYRANVAFLMGDVPRAREALRRALEIEPDNALFRANLDKLG